MKKVLSATLAAALSLSTCLCLAACSVEKTEPAPDTTPTPAPDPAPTNTMTVQDLLDDHAADAATFANKNVLTVAVKDAVGSYDANKVASATFDYGDKTATAVASVGVSFTYHISADELLYEVAAVNFDKSVEVAELQKNPSANVDSTVSPKFSFKYDAEEDFIYEDFSKELFTSVSNGATSSNVIINDKGEAANGYNQFELIAQTDGGYNYYKVNVKAQDSVQDYIDCLSNKNNYTVLSTKTEAFISPVEVKKYEKQTYEIEEPVVVETIGELKEQALENYNRFINAQVSHLYKRITNQTSYQPSYVSNVVATVGADSDTEITQMTVSFNFTYPDNSKSGTYSGTVQYSSPIELNKIAQLDTSSLQTSINNAERTNENVQLSGQENPNPGHEQEVIGDNAATINENLENAYLRAMYTVFVNAYQTEKEKVTSFKWDLGNITNGNIQNMKLYFEYQNTSTDKRVYVVDLVLANPISLNDLLTTKIAAADVSSPNYYGFSYNATQQTVSQTDLQAAAKLLLDGSGFDYTASDTTFLCKVEAGGADAELEVNATTKYTILVQNSQGIRELKITTGAKNLYNAINDTPTNYKDASVSKSIDFTKNQINSQSVNTMEYSL